MNNAALLNVKQVQIEMVSDRGYDISNDQYMNIEINNKTPTQLRELFNFNYRLKSDPKKVLYVHYIYKVTKENKKQKGKMKDTITKPYIEPYVNYLNTYDIYETILIVPVNLGKKAADYLTQFLISSKIKHQIFLEEELSYNPTKHIDVPKHILMNKQEADTLLQNLKINLSMMPIIKLNDPIIKYYGWSKGNIVKIYRHDTVISTLSEKSINYRIIIG